MKNSRRTFLLNSTIACGSLAAIPFVGRSESAPSSVPLDSSERPRQSLSRVKDFVNAGHRDLDTVKSMLDEEPSLIYASWDWGNGDWENALEGASHMGRSDIVRYLIERGARVNPLSYAMLGEVKVVESMIQANPTVLEARGPHYLTLLYHAALSDKTELTGLICDQLKSNRADHLNQAFHGVARLGSARMAAWLIENGVTELSEPNFFGLTPLDEAIKRGDSDLIKLIKSHGGLSANP